MIRFLIFEEDECLWNVVCELLVEKGYTVIDACNDYEGLFQRNARLVVTIPPKDIRSLTAFD
jgi:hypothetical protein